MGPGAGLVRAAVAAPKVCQLLARALAEFSPLATTDGQVAGLSNKADQSAFDVLEAVVATKSTAHGVDLKLSNYSTTAAMNGSIASANNATLATVAANYGLKTAVDQHSLDIVARITPLEVDTKVANALLKAVTAAALASELASRDASISGLQASKADASALTAYALLSAVDTSSEVDSKIAAALLGAVTTAALDAALLGKADVSALAALLCTVDGLDTPLDVDTKIANALLGLAAEAFVAAQLASRDASITALHYYTSSQVDALLGDYRTGTAQDTQTQAAITGALLAYYTSAQVDTLLGDYRTASAQDRRHAAGLPDGPGPGRLHDQITSALVAYRSAADQNTATALSTALLSYYTVAQVDGLLTGKRALALEIAVRFPDDGGRRGGGRHR